MKTPLSAKKAGLAVVIAASIAIPAEGIRYFWYVDPVGVDTVCYGTTTNIDKTKRYTKDECMALLSQDMAEAVRQVDACVPDLPIGVLAAFSDAVYNMGPKIACDTRPAPLGSTAARLLKAGDLKGACQQLPRWNKGKVMGEFIELPGLTKRRAREMEICLKDVT